MTGGDLPAHVGARIRQLRIARAMSQEQLAGPGLSASYLSRIESGARPAGDRLLADLAARLETTPEHLRTGVDPAAAETADLQVRFAELALRSGEPADALARFLEASGNSTVGPDLLRRARLGAGQAREALGELDAALRDFDQVASSSAVGSKTWVDGTLGLVRCYRLVGDFTKSVESGETAMTVLRGRSDWPTADGVRILATLEAAYFDRGDLHHAQLLAAEAVELAGQTGDRRAMASALWNTSLVNAELGAIGDAVVAAERAVGLLADLDAERDSLRARIVLARLTRLNGQPQLAVDQLTALRPAALELGVVTDLGYWHHEYAGALLDVGRLQEAQEAATAAWELVGRDAANGDICITLGRIARARDEPRQANRWLRQAALTLGSVGNGRDAAKSWTELGAALDEAGDVRGARDAYRSAVLALGIAPTQAPLPTGGDRDREHRV